jgi:hypothetical protein
MLVEHSTTHPEKGAGGGGGGGGVESILRPAPEEKANKKCLVKLLWHWRRNGIQHNDTQHKGHKCETKHKGLYLTFSITMPCHYAECHYAQCRILFFIMLTIIMLDVIMVSVIIVSVIMVSVIMVSVIMVSVYMLSVIMLSVAFYFLLC